MSRYVRCGRGEEHWGPWGAAGLWLRCGDLVLLQYRARWSHHGGTWGIPGGALDRGESAVDGAFREVDEETGIGRAAIEVQREHVDDHGGWSFTTIVGTCSVVQPVHETPEGEAQWVPIAELPTLRLHPGLASSWRDLS